jgi:hypothetical protein
VFFIEKSVRAGMKWKGYLMVATVAKVITSCIRLSSQPAIRPGWQPVGLHPPGS